MLDNGQFLRHGFAQYGHTQHFGHLIIIQLITEAKQPLTIKMSQFQFLSASFKCKYYFFVIFCTNEHIHLPRRLLLFKVFSLAYTVTIFA